MFLILVFLFFANKGFFSLDYVLQVQKIPTVSMKNEIVIIPFAKFSRTPCRSLAKSDGPVDGCTYIDCQ